MNILNSKYKDLDFDNIREGIANCYHLLSRLVEGLESIANVNFWQPNELGMALILRDVGKMCRFVDDAPYYDTPIWLTDSDENRISFKIARDSSRIGIYADTVEVYRAIYVHYPQLFNDQEWHSIWENTEVVNNGKNNN